MIKYFRISKLEGSYLPWFWCILKTRWIKKNVLWNFLYRKSLRKHVTRNAQPGEVEYSKIEYKTIKSKIKTTEICQNMQYWTWTSQWWHVSRNAEWGGVEYSIIIEIYLPWNTKYKKMLWRTTLTLHVSKSNKRGRIFK